MQTNELFPRGYVCLLTALIVMSMSASVARTADQKVGADQAPASTAVPRLVRFSGTVKDVTGRTTRGVQDVTFSLYATESGGEALWFETQTVEVDSLGRYTVLLGAMHPDGLPMDLFTSGEARWLGVSVGRLPEQARVLLVSVPYALKAGDSESLGGKPAAAYALQGQTGSSVLAVGEVQKSAAAQGAALTSTTESQPSAVVSAGQTHFIGTTTDYMVRITQNGTGRGLYGLSQSSDAVYGQILGTSGTTYGVRGLTPSTTGAGVFGSNTATTGAAYGVRGNSSSTGGAGVAGFNTAATGSAFGVIGQTSSTGGVALFGRALSATGVTVGLQGIADSTGGTGISAQATAASGTTTGLFAKVNSPSGTALIVDNTGGGKIASFRNNGVLAFSVDGSGNVVAAGSISGGSADFTGGVTAGGNLATGGAVTAVTGTLSANNSSQALSVTQTGSGSAISVNGTSTGLYSYASASSASGIYGVAPAGTAVFGQGFNGVAGFSTGNNIGVWGDGGTGLGLYGTGRIGLHATGNGTPDPIGVIGQVSDPSGVAGVFLHTNSGKILSGRAGPPLGTEVFSVAGDGTVNASGLVVDSPTLVVDAANNRVGIGTTSPTKTLDVATGDVHVSNAGSGIILKSPNGSVCRRITIDNTGTLASTAISCP